MKLSGFKTVFILTVAAVFSGLFLSLSAQQPTDKSGQSAAAPAPQQSTATLSEQKQQEDQESDPLKRALTPQQRVERRKALKGELKGAYKNWLEQDVTYIISDEERKAFKSLTNDEEREAFIEQFWLRRNPNPDSPDN